MPEFSLAARNRCTIGIRGDKPKHHAPSRSNFHQKKHSGKSQPT